MSAAAYFKGWRKGTGLYYADLVWSAKIGAQYLAKIKTRNNGKPKCVIFDIDDTLVFGDPASVIGVREIELGEEEDGQEIFWLPPNKPIVKLAEYAKTNGFIIIVFIARPKTSRTASLDNLKEFKIPFDALIMNDADDDPCFKVNVRRRIAGKYDVCLTIGDQVTDVLCPGPACAVIKLPDPTSLYAYVWLPPGI